MTIPTQGSIILFNESFQIHPPCVLLQKSVPRSNPATVLDPIGIIIIENECDLIEDDSSIKENIRYRKTESVEFLFVYDAEAFLTPIFNSLKNRKVGSDAFNKENNGLLRFIENSDIDNMNFYLPFHPLFEVNPKGLIVYCKKSQICALDQLPLNGSFATVNPPHRDKLRNFHLKYDLRVPTDSIQDLDIISWINSNLN